MRKLPKRPAGDSLGNLLLVIATIAGFTLFGSWQRQTPEPRPAPHITRAEQIHALVRGHHITTIDATGIPARIPSPLLPRGSSTITRIVLAADGQADARVGHLVAGVTTVRAEP